MGQIELFKHLLYLKPFNCMQTNHCYVAEPYKRVDSANKLSVMRVRMRMTKDNEGRHRRQVNKYNKGDDFIAGITNVYVNVHGGCM